MYLEWKIPTSKLLIKSWLVYLFKAFFRKQKILEAEKHWNTIWNYCKIAVTILQIKLKMPVLTSFSKAFIYAFSSDRFSFILKFLLKHPCMVKFHSCPWFLVLFWLSIRSTRQATAFSFNPFHHLLLFQDFRTDWIMGNWHFFTWEPAPSYSLKIFYECRASKSYSPNISSRAFSTSQIFHKLPQ